MARETTIDEEYLSRKPWKWKCKCGWHSANCSERKNKMRVLQINHGDWTSDEARQKFITKEKSLKKRLAQKDARRLKERKS
jgi:hypothetical protein